MKTKILKSSSQKKVPLRQGLSGKLLVLTALFVLLAEILIFIPSVANFRLKWLEDRISTATVIGLIVAQPDVPSLPEMVQKDVILATGTRAIAIRSSEVSKLIALAEMPTQITQVIDLRTTSWVEAVQGAFQTLLGSGEGFLRVIGDLGGMNGSIEIVTQEQGLKTAMRQYARNVAILSILISLFTAVMVFLVINRIMILPIRGMTRSMLLFAQSPENKLGIIKPSSRKDELGIAEIELASMQTQLQKTLSEKKRLAELGLAVSKINHDMRNILASAQLVSDSLSGSEDPLIKRFAPRLVRSLDRAVEYSEKVLSYGSAKETPADMRRFYLNRLIEDISTNLDLDIKGSAIRLNNEVSDDIIVNADKEQLFRAILNITRNAVQAMENTPADHGGHVLSFSHKHDAETKTEVLFIQDTGPGLPERAKANLFEAFKGGVRAGGTGLGLAIAREIISAHGGTLSLAMTKPGCTIFEMRLPMVTNET